MLYKRLEIKNYIKSNQINDKLVMLRSHFSFYKIYVRTKSTYLDHFSS